MIVIGLTGSVGMGKTQVSKYFNKMNIDEIEFSDFSKVKICVGTIITATENDKLKKPSFILTIDFGKVIGIKKSSAQLKANYNASNLINKQILAVVNFKPKQIGKIIDNHVLAGYILNKANGNGNEASRFKSLYENNLKIDGYSTEEIAVIMARIFSEIDNNIVPNLDEESYKLYSAYYNNGDFNQTTIEDNIDNYLSQIDKKLFQQYGTPSSKLRKKGKS